MRRVYIILAIIGFVAPNIPVVIESVETGNWLFWLDPQATLHGMFGNSISTAFIIDLFAAIITFIIWSYFEAKKFNIKNVWLIWILTLLFGIGGPFPLFLYLREKKRSFRIYTTGNTTTS